MDGQLQRLSHSNGEPGAAVLKERTLYISMHELMEVSDIVMPKAWKEQLSVDRVHSRQHFASLKAVGGG